VRPGPELTAKTRRAQRCSVAPCLLYY